MANITIPTVPSDSSNRILQDRFNQDLHSIIKELIAIIEELKARIAVLETP